MNISTRTLGEISDETGGTIQTGPFGTQLHQDDYSDEGVPVVMPKNIVDGRISTENIARVSEEHVERLAQHKLMPGDIVYGRRGDMGRRALISARESGWLCGTGCLRIRVSGSILDPAFLYYYFGLLSVTQWIYNQAIGATLPNLNTTIMRSVPISYPPGDIQLKLARILSRYDELFENNMRRIKILENIAQAVYQEWFANFRFPRQAKTQPDNTSNGRMPQDWKFSSILKVPNFRLITENLSEYEGMKRYFATADVNGVEMVTDGIEYSFDEKPSRAQKQPILNSVWFARMKDTYKVLPFTKVNDQLAKSCILSSGFAGLEAIPPGWFGFLFFTINSADFHAKKDQYCTGATQVSLTNKGLEGIKILLPDNETVLKYGEIGEPIVNEILTLQHENKVLRRTRDLLLPMLISGELDVSDLEIPTPGLNS